METSLKKLHKASDEPDQKKTPAPPSRMSEEHDPVLHSKLKPHSGPASYNPDWGRYRNDD